MRPRSRLVVNAARAGRIVLVCAIIGSAAPAAAVVLCGKKDSATSQLREGAPLKVRSACLATEVEATPAELGLSTQPKLTVRVGSPITTNGALSTPATCEPGEVATGGGVLATAASGGVAAMKSSRPQPDTAGSVPTSWRVTVANVGSAGTITATAYAVCAAP